MCSEKNRINYRNRNYKMDNVVMTPEEVEVPMEISEPVPIDLNTIKITDSNIALNVMVSFLNIAQKRGAFAMNESAKIWECLQKFIVSENKL